MARISTAHFDAFLIGSDCDKPENTGKSASEIFNKVLLEKYESATSHNNWKPRVLVNVAGQNSTNLYWEGEIQFGWEDQDPYEGFKLAGHVPVDSEEAKFLKKKHDNSIPPINIHGDTVTREMHFDIRL